MIVRALFVLTGIGLLTGCVSASGKSATLACLGEPDRVTVTTQGAKLALRPGSTPLLQRVAAVPGEGGVVLSCKPSHGGLKRCVVLFEDVPDRGYGAAAKAYVSRVVYPADEDSRSVEVRVQFAPRAADARSCS